MTLDVIGTIEKPQWGVSWIMLNVCMYIVFITSSPDSITWQILGSRACTGSDSSQQMYYDYFYHSTKRFSLVITS
jgi:hypothetical protein